jgi:hypothetical protein
MNNTFGSAWQRPTVVQVGRLYKFGAKLNVKRRMLRVCADARQHSTFLWLTSGQTIVTLSD